MITAVDTNILIDVFEPDPVYGQPSKEILRQCLHEGSVVACDVVWAEIAVAYAQARDTLISFMEAVGIGFLPMSSEAALKAAACWADYLKKGGRKKRIAADFLIGGHALIQCDRLLTRDKGFYRGYFSNLEIVSPELSEK